MMYIIIAGVIISLSLILVIFIKKKEVQKQIDDAQMELELINNFKNMAPKINNVKQLENYLAAINEDVKKYESDYTFLVAYNDIIRQIRERLRLD